MSTLGLKRISYRSVRRKGDHEYIYVHVPKGAYRGLSVRLIDTDGCLRVSGITDWGLPPNDKLLMARLPGRKVLDSGQAPWSIVHEHLTVPIFMHQGQDLHIWLEEPDAELVPPESYAVQAWFKELPSQNARGIAYLWINATRVEEDVHELREALESHVEFLVSKNTQLQGDIDDLEIRLAKLYRSVHSLGPDDPIPEDF